MANKKATDKELAGLHATVAKVLNAQVGYEDALITYDMKGEEVAGEKRYSAPPATIAAAIKFLKDNQITCDIEQEENLSGLRDKLSKQTRHSDGLGDPRKAATVTHI